MNYKKIIITLILAIMPLPVIAMEPKSEPKAKEKMSALQARNAEIAKVVESLTLGQRTAKFMGDYLLAPLKTPAGKLAIGGGIIAAAFLGCRKTARGRRLLAASKNRFDEGVAFVKRDPEKAALIGAAIVGASVVGYKIYKKMSSSSSSDASLDKTSETTNWRVVFRQLYDILTPEQKTLPFVEQLLNFESSDYKTDSNMENLTNCRAFLGSLNPEQGKLFLQVRKMYLDSRFCWQEKFKMFVLSLRLDQMSLISVKTLIDRYGATKPLLLESITDLMDSLDPLQRVLFESIKYSFNNANSVVNNTPSGGRLIKKAATKNVIAVNNHMPDIASKWVPLWTKFNASLSPAQKNLPYITQITTDKDPLMLFKHESLMQSLSPEQAKLFFELYYAYLPSHVDYYDQLSEFLKVLSYDQVVTHNKAIKEMGSYATLSSDEVFCKSLVPGQLKLLHTMESSYRIQKQAQGLAKASQVPKPEPKESKEPIVAKA